MTKQTTPTENQFLNQKISGAMAARLLGITRARISQCEHEGIIHADSDGLFILKKLVTDWIEYQTSRKDERRLADDARIRQLKIEKLERDEAIAKKLLVPFPEYKEWSLKNVAPLMAEYTGLPSSFTRDIGERRRLDEHIRKIHTRFCARLRKDGTAIQSEIEMVVKGGPLQ